VSWKPLVREEEGKKVQEEGSRRRFKKKVQEEGSRRRRHRKTPKDTERNKWHKVRSGSGSSQGRVFMVVSELTLR
jgi:hypothetical protein